MREPFAEALALLLADYSDEDPDAVIAEIEAQLEMLKEDAED